MTANNRKNTAGCMRKDNRGKLILVCVYRLEALGIPERDKEAKGYEGRKRYFKSINEIYG